MPSFRPFRDHRRSRGAFTLIELLTVITIIVILVGLVIGAAGFANTKASRARAEGEIRALGTVLENYKSDNGAYPRSPSANPYTDNLDARTNGNPASGDKAYQNATKDLYAFLTGQVSATTGAPDTAPKFPRPVTAAGNNYWGDLKPNLLAGVKDGIGDVTAINDPYGFSYGYSTAYEADATATPPVIPPKRGYNPTFDLWSVANKTTTATDTPTAPDTTARPIWIKNW